MTAVRLIRSAALIAVAAAITACGSRPPADGSDAGEAVLFRQLRRRDDDSLSALDAAVGDGPSLARPRRPSGLVEQCADRLEELAAIAFYGQHIVPLPIADGLRRVARAICVERLRHRRQGFVQLRSQDMISETG